MIYELGLVLEPLFGPFRLFSSHGFLLVFGVYAGFILTLIILPRFFAVLPQDRGKSLNVDGIQAKGKPTGSGLIFMLIFAVVVLFVVPLDGLILVQCLLALFVMLSGYLDDRSSTEWSEYLKGGLDLILAFAASLILGLNHSRDLWLPFTSTIISVPLWVFVAISTIIIWLSINVTNCSDGVDGLSGTLVLIALLSMACLLYFILGNSRIAEYLLLPHMADGARWAIFSFCLAGCLAGYLWYNAFPSRVLMGDAGSRPLGFVIGLLVMVSGNPFLILVISTILLVNGGTGLVKVALLRFFNIRIFHSVRFPLHDHMKQSRNWSNAQVLVKFALLQMLIILGVFALFFKIR